MLLHIAFVFLMPAILILGPVTAQEKTAPVSTEADLDAAIATITGGRGAEKKLGYDGVHGYVNSKGKVVTTKDGKEVEFDAIGSSAFASAVVHYVQNASFDDISKNVHQGFGGGPLAAHYQLPLTRSATAAEFLEEMKDKAKRKESAGVYLFELNGEALLTDGSTQPRAHVGFLAVSDARVRQVHFSGLKRYQGLADDDQFDKFVAGSLYKDAPGKKTTTICLWRFTKPADVVRCVVIGVDDYASDPLDGCVADANAMAKFLKRHFGPDRTHVTSLTDPTGSEDAVSSDQVLDILAEAAKTSSSRDYFVLYYSGHGEETDGSLFLPHGGISPNKLASALAKIPAKLVTVILDSCHAGYHAAAIEQALKGRPHIAALAVKSDQQAKTCHFANGAVCPAQKAEGSVFTRWLLRAMADPENDKDKDGIVSWREATLKAVRDWKAAEAYRDFLEDTPGFAPGASLEMDPVFLQTPRL